MAQKNNDNGKQQALLRNGEAGKQMNLLLISSAKSWGGVKTWMLELTAFLLQRGHRAAIVCRPGDLLETECAERGIHCIPFNFGMDFSPVTIARFVRLFRAEQTQLIITNISKETRTAGIAAKMAGIAHVNRLGSFGDLKMTAKTRLIYSYCVDKVFVPSQSLFDHFSRQEFLRPNLRMFHNAVELLPLHIPQNPVVKFAVLAKLSRRKQVDKVLHAFSRLQKLSWELHIGGFGPELKSLQQRCRELGMQRRVFFTARKVNPYEFLRDKDAGILYSSSEAFGIAIIEYMTASCAVIASNVGGIPEIITHEKNGLLVDPQNLDQLEQAVRRLLNDPQYRMELALKGHETVRKHFCRKAIFPRLEAELLKSLAMPHH
ncbi:hypothetical protein CSB45_07805 [candidate division KSB3 bacterium]|uniref:Glycosyl transferase family 1 domain-containing protein n=1 Tax=candidate division KSB3 bacterium TaxID=2044937 RepID=A0A2G6E5P8_9BACT|nr:MAG: hypothetical protein CSB45_07805 [candidate division KSB3 bacterium]PIE29934.1 MAG: hypothetical protein CSA57_06505 [candidate division KSB3 bacterium]